MLESVQLLYLTSLMYAAFIGKVAFRLPLQYRFKASSQEEKYTAASRIKKFVKEYIDKRCDNSIPQIETMSDAGGLGFSDEEG